MSETVELEAIAGDPQLVSPPLYEIRSETLEVGRSTQILLGGVVPYLPANAGAQVYGLKAPAAAEILVGNECWYVVQVAQQSGANERELLEAYPQGINGPRLSVSYNVGWLALRPEVFRTGLGQRDNIRGALSIRPGTVTEVGGANPKYRERFPDAQACDSHKFSMRLGCEDGQQVLDITAGDNGGVLRARTIHEFPLPNVIGENGTEVVRRGEDRPLSEADMHHLNTLMQLGAFATLTGIADFIRTSPLAERDAVRMILERVGVIYSLSDELYAPELAVRDPLTRYWLRVP